ncbi:MAG: RecX family transcriptional regulator [bacterium]|nr:RecX family transcriptional regulator [bacterium]
MPVITSIRRNVKNAARCSIFVDDAFLAACPIDIALAMGLRKGLELSVEMERQLRLEDRRMVFKQKAYRFATYKPRTERQILDHLEKIGCVPEEIEPLMTWLREFRVVDDQGYAERFVAASKERKPLSRSAAKAALLRKGIAKEMIESILNTEYSDEVSLEVARRVADKKLRVIRATSDEERKQKLVRFMQYRGFNWDVIRSVVDDLLRSHISVALVVFSLVLVGHYLMVTPSNAQPNVTPSSAQLTSTCERRTLSAAINRYQPTTLPVVSSDGTILYIDRKLHPDNSEGGQDADDIWISRRMPSGKWSSPVQEPLTTFRRPDALFNFTLDGRHALVVGKYRVEGRDTLRCFAIMSRDADTGLFTRLEPIILPGDKGLGKNYYGHLSEDRATVVIALNRPDSRGDLDLYAASNCKGTWETPVSLGNEVNTTSFEGSPWLGRDNRTLYFASSGRDDRRGKSDLYMTRRLGDTWTRWTTPVNLGPCINTTEDETSLSIVGTSDTALITSWDFEAERPAIVSVKMPSQIPPQPYVVFTAIVLDAVSNDKITAAEMVFTDSSAKCLQAMRASVIDGLAAIALPALSRYSIRTTSSKYVTHEQVLGIRTIDSITPLTLTIRMFDTRKALASVYFDRGSSDVSEIQRATLDSMIAKYEVRNIAFNVVGYTDEIGTRPFNLTLSSKRANAISEELVRLGVDKARVQSTGRGIETLGLSSGISENPLSRRVDIFPAQR